MPRPAHAQAPSLSRSPFSRNDYPSDLSAGAAPWRRGRATATRCVSVLPPLSQSRPCNAVFVCTAKSTCVVALCLIFSRVQFVGCCEAPSLPRNACPSGWAGPDNSNWCYNTVSGGATGYTWAQARTACRALGNDAQLASILDANTQAAIVGPSGRCYGTQTAARTFWIGLGDSATNLVSRTSTNLRWLASGIHSTYVQQPAVAADIWYTVSHVQTRNAVLRGPGTNDDESRTGVNRVTNFVSIASSDDSEWLFSYGASRCFELMMTSLASSSRKFMPDDPFARTAWLLS